MSKNVFGAVVLSSLAAYSAKRLVNSVINFNDCKTAIKDSKNALKQENYNHTIEVDYGYFVTKTKSTHESLSVARKQLGFSAVNIVSRSILTTAFVVGAIACLTDKE